MAVPHAVGSFDMSDNHDVDFNGVVDSTLASGPERVNDPENETLDFVGAPLRTTDILS